MRITFVLPHPNLSGGIRTIASYASRLQARGHEVFLIAIPQADPNWQQQARSLLRGKGWIPKPTIQLQHFERLGLQCQVLERYRPITDADVPDADVVVATWWKTAEWVAKLSPAKGAKAYYIQNYEVFDYLPKAEVEASYRLPLHKITVAEWIVEVLESRFGDRAISLVPPSVDMDQFNAPPRNKQPNPTVGLLYTPTPWKGCDISLKAVELAAQQIPNLRLVAFGFGEPLPVSLPIAVEYNPNPAQHQLREMYAACDAWLFASRSEGVGLPILEAMACRTPVIGTPVGIAPQMLTEGAGILVKPEDPEDMARAIVRIQQLSNADWRAMSDAAYSKATRYTWEDATDRFETALYVAIKRRFQDFDPSAQLSNSCSR